MPWCGYIANADENAAANLAKRFGDEALNTLPFREVEAALAGRFMPRFPDARSASAGLELQPEVIWLSRGKYRGDNLVFCRWQSQSG